MRRIFGPTALAVLVTLVNVAKPVVVDDTAYLTYARHIALHPLDPYGFSIFWYAAPQPATEVLCPPVLPYWLALGIGLFGEQPALLKLWLFPFLWLFTWAVAELLRRFANGGEGGALPLIALSPAVLPMVNLMLDIPALSLGLVALVFAIRAVDRADWRQAVLSGVSAGLAMQTKYTALLIPPLIAWYGLTHRKAWLAAVAIAIAVAIFAGWEWLLAQQYGQSHFLFHLDHQPGQTTSEPGAFISHLRSKVKLLRPLVCQLGCLAFGITLYAGRAVGFQQRALGTAAALWSVGVALIALLPLSDTVLISGTEPHRAKVAVSGLVWNAAGVVALITVALAVSSLLVRDWRQGFPEGSADNLFVVGWVLIELGGYFVLTPFPAARRVIGLSVATGILAARLVSRVNGTNPERRPPVWVVPFGVAVGVLVAALDAFDAYPEKVIAERAAREVRDLAPTAPVWYTGHLGFQYYCERAGMKPVYQNGPRLQPGDYLVAPVYPTGARLHRPIPAGAPVCPPPNSADLVAELVWNDGLSAQTIPNWYGATEPIVSRDAPRVRVAIYRITRPWTLEGQ